MRLHTEVVEARAALRAGQPEAAAALARRALDQDPADRDAAVLLGLALEAAGRGPEAVTALAAAACLPGVGGSGAALPEPAVAALQRLLPAALPDRLTPELQAVLPGAGPAGSVAGNAFRVVAPEGTLLRAASDPKYGWSFSRRAVVYIGTARRYSIYYQAAGDRGLVVRVAELLGRLDGAASLLPDQARPAEVRVWLPHAGRAGGEQFHDSLYLFAVGVPRGDGEWVREVAHELGHLALPSFASFDAPEPMENGYLGERLLPQWLLELGERSVWDGRVSLADYLRERAAPLRRRYLDDGPASPLRLERGPAGMEYAIGLILTLEAQHGPAFLARLIARQGGEGLESLLVTYREEVAALNGYRIPAELVVPRQSVTAGMARGKLQFRRATYRAYLPSGRWQIAARGERLAGAQLSVDAQKAATATGSEGETRAAVTTDVSRWHLIRVEAGDAGAALAEISLSRAPAPGRAAPAKTIAARGRSDPPAERK